MTTQELAALAVEAEAAPENMEAEIIQRGEGGATTVSGLTSITGLAGATDDASGIPMSVRAISSAGYVYVYHTETGDRSRVHRNMLPGQLKKRLPNGKRAFTVAKPPFEPVQGTLKCWLHKDAPLRPVCDEYGFVICKKSNMPNPHQQALHVQRKHPVEYAALERRRQERERAEDRQVQHQLLATLGGTIVARETAVGTATEAVETPADGICPDCGWKSAAKTRGSRQASVYSHRQRAHVRGEAPAAD